MISYECTLRVKDNDNPTTCSLTSQSPYLYRIYRLNSVCVRKIDDSGSRIGVSL